MAQNNHKHALESDLSSVDEKMLNQIKLPSKVAVVGKGMVKNNTLLDSILQTHIIRYYPLLPNTIRKYTSPNENVDAFIGWGNKKSFLRAKQSAIHKNVPTFSIEDGFIRSLDSGLSSRHGLSVIIDDLGIYYDLIQPSRLEQMICHRLQIDNQENWSNKHHKIANQLISKIVSHQLSKYNDSTYCPNLSDKATLANPSQHILLIDQVLGDQSIISACGNEKEGKKQFRKMLKDVFKNHPDSTFWIKAHPAHKKGYLTEINLPKKYQHRIKIISESVNPIALLKQVQHVYTVSSHMGFEALMLKSLGQDIQVHCYGINWYAGWGLTNDSGLIRSGIHGLRNQHRKKLVHIKQRRFKKITHNQPIKAKDSDVEMVFSNRHTTLNATIEQLFFASYLDYSHYVNPASGQPCDINTALDWLITNRLWANKLKTDKSNNQLIIYEFSRWKLPFVKSFVNFPQTQLFIKPKPRLKNRLHPDHFRVNLKYPVLVWGLAKKQQVLKKLKKIEAITDRSMVYCMEDGFIRSNGLGATLLEPLSVVIDTQGIYYDATLPSDLESLLKDCPQLTQQQLLRVNNLQKRLLEQKVSKYNVGQQLSSHKWLLEAQQTSAHKILIVGQVEDDLSVQYCASSIKTNTALIKQVAQMTKKYNTNTYLIYKPHPDVEAGLRPGKVNKDILKLVDAVANDVGMPDCLELVDEVHTISSLSGFEALLRNKKVSCYGLPFYAGWGLTTDINCHLHPKNTFLKRRKRRTPLTLEQLLYCTLIKYPLYQLPNGYGLAQVEEVIHYLYTTDDKKRETSQKQSSTTDNRNYTAKKISQQTKLRFMQGRHRFKQFHNIMKNDR